VERTIDGVEVARIDVAVTDGVVQMDAVFEDSTAHYEMVATRPGIAVTGTAVAIDAELMIINGRVARADGTRLDLDDREQHNEIHAAIAGTSLVHNLAAVAPFRQAIEARLSESAPLFEVVALFQEWPDGGIPPWPELDDPRDIDPPGHIPGDLVGIGMTCSPAIRCPNSAPFCVTVNHDVEFGFCTRACGTDDECAVEGAAGQCSLQVIDIPGTPETVRTCRVGCLAAACPGLLSCEMSEDICLPEQ